MLAAAQAKVKALEDFFEPQDKRLIDGAMKGAGFSVWLEEEETESKLPIDEPHEEVREEVGELLRRQL